MGAFEDFVNANLGVRMPLFIDTTTPELSSKSAGSLGSKFVDSSTNYLYEKTGFTNADWVKIADLGQSRGGSSISLTGGYNIEIDQAGSTYTVNLLSPFTGALRIQDSGIVGTGDGIPFVVTQSGQVALNVYTTEGQTTGFLTPYQFHVSGVTALSGSEGLDFNSQPALTVFGDSEVQDGGIYPAALTTSARNSLPLIRGGSGALIYNTDSNQLEVNNGSTWRTLSGAALGSGVSTVANIGAGSGIASGVVDDTASFKSLIGGTNLQILGDENSLTLNVTGVSGADGSGVSSFTGLSDTPSSLEANQFLKVSSDATGLIYSNLSGEISSQEIAWNVYSTTSDLPSATDHHGMFAHVHAEDAAYMAHAGNWVKIYPLVTGAEGLGDGSGVFKEISSYNLQFKSLLGGDNVRITGDGSTLTFDVTGISGGSTTGITGATNLGAGSGLISGITDNDLQVKSLVGGTNLQITGDGESLYLNVTGISAGGGGGGTGEVCITGTGPASLPKVKARSNFSGRLPDVIYGLFTAGSYRTACYFTSIEDEGQANDRIFYHPLEYSAGFPYVAFENDSTGAFKLAVEVTAETGSDGENLSLQQYIDNGHAAFYNSGCGAGGGGGGTGITGASNIGIGSGILSGISDNDLVFRTIESGPNVNITESSSGLKISATTSAFVSGGSVSGGIGLNPFVSGYSNFYTTLPDQIILQSAAPDGSPPIPYTLNFFDAVPYIYYENTAAGGYSIARFDNDSVGSNGAFLGNSYHPNPLGSLSGLIGSGRGIYLGGV